MVRGLRARFKFGHAMPMPIAGNALAQCLDLAEILEARLQLVSAVDRLNLTSSKLKSILQDSREQIDALHATLGK